VWITKEEIVALAKLLELTPEETVEQYCHKVDGRFSLRERRNAQGQYDCIFLRDERARSGESDAGGDGGDADGNRITQTRRVCGVYAARPLQCRTWPFWPGNLASEEQWNAAAVRCHGMNRGRKFSSEEIAKIEDAEEWPERPPTS
jgi:Fe-S-cluster containining protein